MGVWDERVVPAPPVPDVEDFMRTNSYSRAFQTWCAVDFEIANFVHVGVVLAERSHRAMFDAVESSGLYDPEVDEQGDAYGKHVGGLDLGTQQWLTVAGGLQAMVANFELYVEEVSLQRLKAMVGGRVERTPPWGTLVREWKVVGVDLEDDDTTKARNLRHQLAHKLSEDRRDDADVRPHSRPWPSFQTEGFDPRDREVATSGDRSRGDLILTAEMFEKDVRAPLARKAIEIEGALGNTASGGAQSQSS